MGQILHGSATTAEPSKALRYPHQAEGVLPESVQRPMRVLPTRCSEDLARRQPLSRAPGHDPKPAFGAQNSWTSSTSGSLRRAWNLERARVRRIDPVHQFR